MVTDSLCSLEYRLFTDLLFSSLLMQVVLLQTELVRMRTEILFRPDWTILYSDNGIVNWTLATIRRIDSSFIALSLTVEERCITFTVSRKIASS